MDSSAVVAMMAGALSEPVKTFSIDFEEESFSEAAYAARVAALYRTEHRVRTATVDVVDLIDALVWHADDPLADSSMIPVYMVSRFAREHVTMVLTGDGDDVTRIRELGTRLLGALVRHRQRGADLVYEAYQVDIGGET